MDAGTAIGLGFGGGTLAITFLGLMINAHYRSKETDQEDTKIEIEQEKGKKADRKAEIEAVCHVKQERILKIMSDGDRRLHERMDDTKKDIATLSESVGTINGQLEIITQSVNGGLEEKIQRAVKAALPA